MALPDRHPGLAAERTRLAGARTGIAGVACVAAVIGRSWPLSNAGQIAVAVLVAIAAVIGLIVVIRTPSAPGPLLGERRVRQIASATLVLAVAALVLEFVPRSSG
jgi:hypothetical protein